MDGFISLSVGCLVFVVVFLVLAKIISLLDDV